MSFGIDLGLKVTAGRITEMSDKQHVETMMQSCTSSLEFPLHVHFLVVSIKELENERLSMQADTENYSEQVVHLNPNVSAIVKFSLNLPRFKTVQVQRLLQKLQIMTEMYQENELKLHR